MSEEEMIKMIDQRANELNLADDLAEMLEFLQFRFKMTLEQALIEVVGSAPEVMRAFIRKHQRDA